MNEHVSLSWNREEVLGEICSRQNEKDNNI